MNYFVLDPANGTTAPNFANLFAAYNAANNLPRRWPRPQRPLREGRPGNGTTLTTNQRTQLALGAPNIACVTGMITCTAVIAKCGASPYFVLHAGSGVLDTAAQDTPDTADERIRPGRPGGIRDPRTRSCADLYERCERTQRAGLRHLLYHLPGGSIGSVQVNGAGALYLL